MTNEKKQTPMLEVRIEKNFDVVEKSWDEKVFTKIYHSIRTSGLLAQLSDKDFRTLICLSTFIDSEGRCYPSQEALAKALGISRSAVAKRMKTLLAFRWHGKPLVHAKKVRCNNGSFENTVYTVLPEASLRIFDGKDGENNHVNESHVATSHLNQNQTNKLITVTERKKVEIDPLAMDIARDMGDTRSLPYYQKMVRDHPASVLLRARGEVLEEPNIKRSKGAMFAYLVKKHTRVPPAYGSAS